MADYKCTKEPVFTKIFVSQESIKKDVSHIRKYLEDNGTPGLITKSNIAHDFIIAQKQKEESHGKMETWSRQKMTNRVLILAGLGYVIIRIIYDLIKIKLFGG